MASIGSLGFEVNYVLYRKFYKVFSIEDFMDIDWPSLDILQGERVDGSHNLVKYLYLFISCFIAFGSFWELFIFGQN